MNKKAGYAQPIIDFYATVIVILIIVVFFILAGMGAKEREILIDTHIADLDSGLMLNSFLRSEIKYEEKLTPISEIIDVIDMSEPRAVDGSFLRELRPHAIKHIALLEKATGCPFRLVFVVDDSVQEVKSSISPDKKCKKTGLFYQISQKLPSQSKDITVELFGGIESG